MENHIVAPLKPVWLNHSFTATYKVPNFDKTNWDAGHNYLRGNDRNNGLSKYAPAIQTSDQMPLNTLVNSGGKKAPSDAKLSGYKFVTKISGLGLPTHFSSTSREMHILVVDQNGRVTNEDLTFYSSTGDWNPYKAKVSDWDIKEVENNLTAQQLYDRVKNNETLVSRQNDGTILIANGVGVDALEMTDDFITNYVKSSSVQYAIANATE